MRLYKRQKLLRPILLIEGKASTFFLRLSMRVVNEEVVAPHFLVGPLGIACRCGHRAYP
jgi:hypothetical protein